MCCVIENPVDISTKHKHSSNLISSRSCLLFTISCVFCGQRSTIFSKASSLPNGLPLSTVVCLQPLTPQNGSACITLDSLILFSNLYQFSFRALCSSERFTLSIISYTSFQNHGSHEALYQKRRKWMYLDFFMLMLLRHSEN